MAIEPATTKLIELSKKYRDRTAEVEALKTKCKNLEATLVIKDDKLGRQRTELQQILKPEIRKDSGDSQFLLLVLKAIDLIILDIILLRKQLEEVKLELRLLKFFK